jgi:uncharacterized protein
VSCLDLTLADTQPLEFAERVELPEGAGGEDVVSVQALEIAGEVERASRGYLAHGSVRGSATLRCVRCLGRLPFHYREAWEVELRPSSSAPREDDVQLYRGDLDVRFYASPELDLAELAAEQFELAVPLKPVCREDCKGLCPRCGANLNEGSCGCLEEKDERWASLANWEPSN